MRGAAGRIAVGPLFAAALALTLSGAAAAESRDFSGTVAEISADKMEIDNRRGDRVSFRRAETTKVTGTRKSWQAIEAGDRVSVSWKMGDKPRVAHKVVVKSPKKAGAE